MAELDAINIEKLERETLNDYFKFYNELAEKYPESERVYASKSGIVRKINLIKILEKEPESLTLDLGCNDGPYQPYIRRYVGLDMASAFLNKIKAPSLQALAQKIPFRSNVFERILATDVLEHIWDRDQVLRECRRVLKRNGEIIVSVPLGDGHSSYKIGSKKYTTLFLRYGCKYIPYVHGRFSKEYLRLLLEKNGFTVKWLDNLGTTTLYAIGVNK